jgi:hypothetical protein
MGGTDGAGDVSPIDLALARFEDALSAVSKARRPGADDDPDHGPDTVQTGDAGDTVQSDAALAHPPADERMPRGAARPAPARPGADSVWLETTTMESDPRGAALWNAPPAAASAPARVERAPAAMAAAAAPAPTRARDEPASPGRSRGLVAALAVGAVLVAGAVFALRPHAAAPLAKQEGVAPPTVAETASPAPAAASAGVDAATAAHALDAAPTAAGPVPAVPAAPPAEPASGALPSPAVITEAARPARKSQARPSPDVSAAVAAAQQRADQFLASGERMR